MQRSITSVCLASEAMSKANRIRIEILAGLTFLGLVLFGLLATLVTMLVLKALE